jgi:glyoxylase-like metal-dependent hydrolase (beta-lactamase superfamily II)
MMSGTSTPMPPATEEFAYVTPGGASYVYPSRAGVQVKKLSVGRWDNNVYLIACDGEAVVIDAAADAQRIVAELDGANLRAILQTHNHPDHTGALGDLVALLGVPVLSHQDDPMPVPTQPLADGQVYKVGSAELRVLYTPGHTPGSTCFLVGDHLFTGDTLFPGGPGNTERDPIRFAQIMESLARLFELPDRTRVSPGHGLDTTLGRERPYLGVWHARGW